MSNTYSRHPKMWILLVMLRLNFQKCTSGFTDPPQNIF